jgi:predicted acylesterase/phospholipase RssA
MTDPAAGGAPEDRFCDVVMEGGITSGIIYASAASELAKHYRFRNVGGSSIGAFAAAVTAAAEYSRRYDRPEGFTFLAGLPDELKKQDGDGRTGLRNLFMPQKGTRRLFEVFLATIGHTKLRRGLPYGLVAALRQYWLHVFFGLLAAAFLTLGPLEVFRLGLAQPEAPSPGWNVVASTVVLLMTFAICVVLAVLAGIVWDFLVGVVPNGFGLCRGWSAEESHNERDLAAYLHGEGVPLTFKDLWEAPDPPTSMLGFVGSEKAQRSINLEVYATNLAHSRPYRFPLDDADDMGRLFFRLEDMQDYFPKPILLHLAAHARPYQPKSDFDPPADERTEQYLEVPQEHLPIAVAARLALSFPFLISAVPLWAIDYEAPKRAKKRFSKCWMSDGGLCSNFPIHLFDSFLPKWPTFGISLHTRDKFWERKAVWLPKRHMQGRADLWHRIEGGSFSQLTGFLLGLWTATWRWNDMTMMRMPGVRDRVVRIFLEDNEGGVNIKMTPENIAKLADVYGRDAAQAFVKKFAEARSYGWLEHRWVRFNRLLIALREQIEGFEFSAMLKQHAEPMDIQIAASRYVAPLRGPRKAKDLQPSETCLDADQALELKTLLVALTNLEAAFRKAGNHRPYKAVPRPSLRVRHPT